MIALSSPLILSQPLNGRKDRGRIGGLGGSVIGQLPPRDLILTVTKDRLPTGACLLLC